MDTSCSKSLYPSLSDLEDGEELRRWRESLKQEVEEDIDRQVQLRLKSNPYKLHGTEKSYRQSFQWHSSKQKFQSNFILVESASSEVVSERVTAPNTELSVQQLRPTHHQSDKVHVLPWDTNKADISSDDRRTGNGSENGFSGNKSNTKLDSHIYVAKKIGRDAQSQTLSKLYEYVHMKYGCPFSQLQRISRSQTFKTKPIDTSGCGIGPIIYSPVESNVSQCAPKHALEAESREDKRHSCGDEYSHGDICSRNGEHSQNGENSHDGSFDEWECHIKKVEDTIQGLSRKKQGFSQLQFESNFESGNLLSASQIGLKEYELRMSPDLYSERHTQWFYFKIQGMVARENYKFHIVNFIKPGSLYNEGMQPLLYSERLKSVKNQGWTRVGSDVSYHKTESHQHKVSRQFYTLTWIMTFPYSDDTCYLAYCYPYTYSRLLSQLDKISQSPLTSPYFSQQVLCLTLAGNLCPLLTISDKPGNCMDESMAIGQLHEAKLSAIFELFSIVSGEPVVMVGVCGAIENTDCPAIVVSARVHPGETNSSWVMEGFLNYLLSDCDEAKELRRNYVIKIIPMLNPDGVIVGNYRTSLAGVDLNRVYKHPEGTLFPTVYHTKKLIRDLMQERKLLLYVDLHGHSRKHNVFTYGCHTPHSSHKKLLHEHVFPFLLSKESPTMFDYQSCKFDMHRCKEATGRVVVWKMGVANSFTLESTFCGSSWVSTKKQFSIEDLKEMGWSLVKGIHHFHHYLSDERHQEKILSEIAGELLSRVSRKSLCDDPQHSCQGNHLNLSSKTARKPSALEAFLNTDISILEKNSSTSGSDSENDNFFWKSTKKNKKKIRAITKLDKVNLAATGTEAKNTAGQIRCAPSGTHGKLKLPPINAMDKPRVPNSQVEPSIPIKLPPVKKFVSKYKDRSNGGIPIFSDERIKERRDKRLIQNPYQEMKASKKDWCLPNYSVDSLSTINATLDLFRTAYSNTEEKLKKFDTKKAQKRTTSLLMEEWKISSELKQFIQDSWKL